MYIPEIFATCSIEPSVVRHAVSSTMNTSTAKINVLGGYHWITTCSMAGKSSIERFFHGKETMAHAHVAIECPEIMEAFMRKKSDGGDELRGFNYIEWKV